MLTSIRGLTAATLALGSALAATPALADGTAPPSEITVSGSAAVVSQYRFRGLSQSNNLPAVQASTTSTGTKIGEDVDDVQVSTVRLACGFTQDGKGREQAVKDNRNADEFGQ